MSSLYEHFFRSVNEFQQKQNLQKMRGLNDYNPLLTVYSHTNEVHLHSKMLHSFFDPSARHYQNSLFLQLFFSQLAFKNINMNWELCRVYREYKNIDIYITDGTYHLIIENKIQARDQKGQLKKYIDSIYKDHEEVKPEQVLLVYLSLDAREPSKTSLGSYSIASKENERGIYTKEHKLKAKYQAICYKKTILPWLKQCQFEVQNITNLNVAFQQYIDVVTTLYNDYQSNIMSLSDFLAKNPEHYPTVFELYDSLPVVREQLIKSCFERIQQILSAKLDDSQWDIYLEDNYANKWGVPIIIEKRSWQEKEYYLHLAIQFERANYGECYFGIGKSDGPDELIADVYECFKDEIDAKLSKVQKTNWWLHWEYITPAKVDFIHFALDPNNAEIFANKILNLIEAFETGSGLLSRANEFIAENFC